MHLEFQGTSGLEKGAYRLLNLNFEVEDLRFIPEQCGAGFPACRFAGLSSPASGRLKSRPNWQTRMSARRTHPCRVAGRLPNSSSITCQWRVSSTETHPVVR